MTSISDKDLKAIRAEQRSNMPDTVYVQEKTSTDDGMYGKREAWTTVPALTTVGRIKPLRPESNRDSVIGEQLGSVTRYEVHLPYDAEIDREKHRLQINGVQYQIEPGQQRSQNSTLRLICSEVA